jgi:diazepam-binding inhibitor (GABA receptor modulating acyl-CoA-binding protein)
MEYSDSALELQFEKATNYVREGNFSASQADQLQFYGYYKQGTVGPAKPEDAPGFFDFTGKAKFAAWSALGIKIRSFYLLLIPKII